MRTTATSDEPQTRGLAPLKPHAPSQVRDQEENPTDGCADACTSNAETAVRSLVDLVLHPSGLVCAGCGAAVGVLPEDAELGELTAAQGAHAWPGLAEDVAGHDAGCPGAAPGLMRVRVAEQGHFP